MEYPEFLLLALPYMAASSSKVEYGIMCWALGLGLGYLIGKVFNKPSRSTRGQP